VFANLPDCYRGRIAREAGDGRFDEAEDLVAAASPNSLIKWPGAPSPEAPNRSRIPRSPPNSSCMSC